MSPVPRAGLGEQSEPWLTVRRGAGSTKEDTRLDRELHSHGFPAASEGPCPGSALPDLSSLAALLPLTGVYSKSLTLEINGRQLCRRETTQSGVTRLAFQSRLCLGPSWEPVVQSPRLLSLRFLTGEEDDNYHLELPRAPP